MSAGDEFDYRCCICGCPCDNDTGAWINGVFEPMCLECE